MPGGVRPGHGGIDFAQAQAIGAELVGIEVDLILARRTADRGNLGHAGHAVELVADVPVLD
jgi:hypothetical protein